MKVMRSSRSCWIVMFASSLLLTACSTAWIGEAEQIVAVLLPGIANVLTLVATLQGSGTVAEGLATMQSAGQQTEGDMQLLQSLILQYEKASAQERPGILGKVEAETGVVQTDLGGLLAAVHVKDAATQAKIAAVVGVMLAEVQSLAAILPAANENAVRANAVFAKPERTKKTPLGAAKFVNLYNAVMTAKTSNAALDRTTAGLKIHSSAKLRRWIDRVISKR